MTETNCKHENVYTENFEPYFEEETGTLIKRDLTRCADCGLIIREEWYESADNGKTWTKMTANKPASAKEAA